MGLCKRKEISESRAVIEVSGWIGSTNAAEFGTEINRCLMGMEPKQIVLDAQSLEYISSAGLRELMKLRKKYSDISVINVSDEIYDIFEVTGFKDVLGVRRKIREISLDGCPLVGEGEFGRIYRLDNDKIVKMYRPDMPLEKIHAERQLAQKAFILGVPTAISYDVVQCGSSYGLVFEMFKADTLAGLIEKQPETASEYGRRCARLLREIHTITPEPGALPDQCRRYLDWIESMSTFLADDEKSLLREYLIMKIPSKNIFLHGDFHCKNIMVVDGELMLIDIGNAAAGNPAYDLGQITFSQIIIPKTVRTPEEAQKLLGFSPDTARKFTSALISEYFETSDREKLSEITKKLDPIALFALGVYASNVNKGNEKALSGIAQKIIRENLIPAVRE